MRARWWKRLSVRPALRDAIVAGFWLLIGVFLWAVGAYPLWGQLAVVVPPPWAFLCSLGALASVGLMRSRRPLLALTLGLVIAVVDILMGGSLGVMLGLTDLVYAAIIYGSDRAVQLALRGFAAGGFVLVIALFWLVPRNPMAAAALLQWGLVLLVSGLWGWNVRSERRRTSEKLSRQHSEAIRTLRTGIAQDLHDLVANQIAVAGLHIEAAKLQADRAQIEATALRLSLDRAKTGTDRAHEELRSLISILTVVDETTTLTPLKSIADLTVLEQLLPAERHLRVSRGTAEALRDGLSPAPEPSGRLVARALQELVANAAKHGEGDVALTAICTAHDLRITVENDFAPLGASRGPGSGLGLAGVRVLLGRLGGTFEAGAVADRWRAVLIMPRPASDGSQLEGRTV